MSIFGDIHNIARPVLELTTEKRVPLEHPGATNVATDRLGNVLGLLRQTRTRFMQPSDFSAAPPPDHTKR